jgi:hypothetical protein
MSDDTQTQDTFSVWYLTKAGTRRHVHAYRSWPNARAGAYLIMEQGYSAEVIRNHHIADGRVQHTVVGTFNSPGMPGFPSEAVAR